ncbi:ATP-dependent Clp protease adapter ClpS [Vibrio sp. SS-MA-C1-2]|uniref:ATP-dependent Clp protease adapter ClpS n=1 Tax=Vibrio sp. SS-MA-C1-2 TaxID=2908646 RepID=UPI001F1DC5EC|nr:ATP-dependent Clp protease adapter ClpS [Vibrio sp. SS-MA-C1-2]UJF19881.1 ATP-dependent Clp protease adapter ClpS [Vibrio sp. SS-MA-C1-2]
MSKLYEWITPDTDLAEAVKSEVKPPAMYNVIINNDDYTPMDFVIDVLQRYFSMDIDSATQIMLAVHYKGKAICGTYSAEIAETKVAQINLYAKENEHPLLCTLEKA